MLKVNDFVFALLTLICISSVAGEERVIYPKAKEWPLFSDFGWGINSDKFYEICKGKGFTRDTKNWSEYQGADGKIFELDAQILPSWERIEGEFTEKFLGLGLQQILVSFKEMKKEDGAKLVEKLHGILTSKYGPPKKPFGLFGGYRWGAPDKPHIPCLELSNRDHRSKGKLTNLSWVTIAYCSKAFVEKIDRSNKYKAKNPNWAKDLMNKSKIDEKDF